MSLPIPNHKIDAFTAPRGLKFCTELILWSSRSTTIPRRVTHQPKAGRQPTKGWSPTNLRMVTQRRKRITDLEFGTYILFTKLTPGKNCHGWSSTIPKMVILTQGWSPTNLRMVTHQRGVCSIQGIWHLDLTYQTNTRWHLPWMVTHYPSDGHPPTQGRSPTNLRMVNHQRGVCSIQGILHLDITYQTNTRWHLPWMVTHLP